jgi:hypothetical protein
MKALFLVFCLSLPALSIALNHFVDTYTEGDAEVMAVNCGVRS